MTTETRTVCNKCGAQSNAIQSAILLPEGWMQFRLTIMQTGKSFPQVHQHICPECIPKYHLPEGDSSEKLTEAETLYETFEELIANIVEDKMEL